MSDLLERHQFLTQIALHVFDGKNTLNQIKKTFEPCLEEQRRQGEQRRQKEQRQQEEQQRQQEEQQRRQAEQQRQQEEQQRQKEEQQRQKEEQQRQKEEQQRRQEVWEQRQQEEERERLRKRQLLKKAEDILHFAAKPESSVKEIRQKINSIESKDWWDKKMQKVLNSIYFNVQRKLKK